MQYLITPLLEVLNPTNTVSRNRLLSFAIGNVEAEIYNCLIAKHVYYNNQGKLHEGGWFYSTVKDLHLSSGYAEDAQKTAEMFDILLGDNLAERKKFIEEHGNECLPKGISKLFPMWRS